MRKLLIILVDFGRVSFGNIRLTAPSGVNKSILSRKFRRLTA